MSYTVIMRNPTSEVVAVTGVVADGDRDGAFVPERAEDGTATQEFDLGIRVEVQAQGC